MKVSFATDIKPLFRPIDVAHMQKHGVKLDDFVYMSDPVNALAVQKTLTGTPPSMPPGGPYWTRSNWIFMPDGSLTAISPNPRQADGPWILAATILGSSMAFIDGTVVNVALPALQSALHATLGRVQWVVESYTLFLAALLLIGGSLGDLYGRRKNLRRWRRDPLHSLNLVRLSSQHGGPLL